jgi:PAS domain S-box-containing protein
MPAEPTGNAPVPDPRMAQALSRDRRRVVLSYLVMALAWMISTDSAVQALVPDPQQAALWQGVKGSFFALASAGLLYLLLRPLAEHVLHTHARQQASELRLRQMFEGNPGPILVYDLDTLAILDANPAACSAFGWERDELLEQTIDACGRRARTRRCRPSWRRSARRPRSCASCAQLQLRDGSLRQMELRSNAISYDGHNARLLIAIDRTAEDLAQLRRDQALARVEEAHELARIGAWELDPSTGMGRYSNQVYRLLGRRPPEARRWHRFDELLVPADPATATQTEQLLADLCSGEPVQVDVLLPLLSMDGRALMVHLRAASGVDESGRSRVLGTLQDVTEREQSRRLLREREEQFRELVRVLPDGVVILSDEHVLYANAWAASLFGYGSHTLLGEPLSALVAAGDLPGCAASCAPASHTWAPATAAWWPCSAPTAAASMPAWRWAKCATAAATASC